MKIQVVGSRSMVSKKTGAQFLVLSVVSEQDGNAVVGELMKWDGGSVPNGLYDVEVGLRRSNEGRLEFRLHSLKPASGSAARAA